MNEYAYICVCKIQFYSTLCKNVRLQIYYIFLVKSEAKYLQIFVMSKQQDCS